MLKPIQCECTLREKGRESDCILVVRVCVHHSPFTHLTLSLSVSEPPHTPIPTGNHKAGAPLHPCGFSCCSLWGLIKPGACFETRLRLATVSTPSHLFPHQPLLNTEAPHHLMSHHGHPLKMFDAPTWTVAMRVEPLHVDTVRCGLCAVTHSSEWPRMETIDLWKTSKKTMKT